MGKITINGIAYDISSGANIAINDGQVFVNGENITVKNIPNVEVKIEGSINSLKTNWCKRHRKQGCRSNATAGEQFIYEFLPSGIVECQTVKCLCCGKEFTDCVD